MSLNGQRIVLIDYFCTMLYTCDGCKRALVHIYFYVRVHIQTYIYRRKIHTHANGNIHRNTLPNGSVNTRSNER